MAGDLSTSFGNSIMSKAQRFVTVDGKDYVVKRTQYKNPLIPTIGPVYKDAVVVNGTKHYVTKVPSLISADKTKDIVIINGKTYDVYQKNDIMSVIRSAVEKMTNKK